jgi:hypothetical protein
MKRTLLLTVSLALGMLTLTAKAQFNYETNAGTIAIWGYSGPAGNVTIPDTINGLPVTYIVGSTFWCRTDLTSVKIGNSVVGIDHGTFYGCTNLMAITVDTSNANYSCVDGVLFNKPMTTLILCAEGKTGTYTIPSTVTSVGPYAFQGCGNLNDIAIPVGVTAIEEGAFSCCTSLTSVVIPQSVARILNRVHYGPASSMERWETGAFAGCTSLTNVSFGASVLDIGPYSFAGCSSLSSVVIPVHATSIEEGVFAGCTSLTSIVIPDSVETIVNRFHSAGFGWNYWGAGAFAGCTGLTNVSIGVGVIDIGPYAFGGCTNLVNLTIGKRVTAIREGAFGGCSGLRDVMLPTALRRIEAAAFSDCTGLTSLNIPDFVVGIAGAYDPDPQGSGRLIPGALAHCTGLTNVTIGNSVTSIGDAALEGCISLTGVYFQGNAPGFGSRWAGPFNDSTNVTVYYLPGTSGWDTNYAGRPTASWVLPYPVILNSSPRFGLSTNGFGFTVSWATTVPFVVEATTSLVNPAWTPLATNTLVNGTSYFSDAEWTNHPSRFYRVRSH